MAGFPLAIEIQAGRPPRELQVLRGNFQMVLRFVLLRMHVLEQLEPGTHRRQLRKDNLFQIPPGGSRGSEGTSL